MGDEAAADAGVDHPIRVNRGPRFIWWFVVLMTLYNAVKYPIIAATADGQYAISSILGGTVKAAAPKWFLMVHVPLMVISNMLAAGIGFGWKQLDQNRFAYLSVLFCELLNGLIIVWPATAIYTHLGSMVAAQATVMNFGALALTGVLLTLSAVNVRGRFKWFWIAFAAKCFLIFFGEMGALFKNRTKHM